MTDEPAPDRARERAPEPAGGRFVRVDHPALGPDGPVEGVALVTLDRPDVLNALSYELLGELVVALERLDADPACRCIVLTGAGDRAFAAGADIRELAAETPVSLLVRNTFALWERLRRVRTPLVAAVRGFALGGGCELAMACDMIVAGEDAQFGQPEIRIGVMPGAGGTQRLTRAIGKAKAMEMVLTGRSIDAREAEAHGLVTRVVPVEETVEAALELARRVASMPPVAVLAAKEAVERAFELSLSAGLEYERRTFFLLFATEDQKEGMAAFVEKRAPEWRGR
ncbi:MAG TPA: enoyl-CoA hydratase-related protein [Candidatus Limnocylindrales bacterium]|nr:enoyl-CoA hydratase-related protein [Candidatus Limnocylindrales bacterium]